MEYFKDAFLALIITAPTGAFICTVLVHSSGWSLQAGIIAGLALTATLSIGWMFKDYLMGYK